MAKTDTTSPSERRRYPRLQRPVLYRAPSLFDRWGKVHDVSLGGCRICSDVKMKPGREIILDVLTPDQTVLTARARVVWCSQAADKSTAEWEIGMQFYPLPPGDQEQLQKYLESTPEES